MAAVSPAAPTHSALRRVDAINAFGVSAGRFASFDVVSRTQIQYLPSSSLFLDPGSIPGSSTEDCWSEG
jgi:hypothetical protein